MTPILNRDFQHPSDGWYMIEPLGVFPNRRAKIVQVIDRAALNSIATAFAAEAAKPGFAGMLIDHEHFRHDTAQESRAYGWLMNVQVRDDGLYGQIRWTKTGREAVDGGDYRFFSTEYLPADVLVLNSGEVTPEGFKQVRPIKLAGLTLTNDPNNKGGRPITNRADGASPTPQKKDTMKSVAHALGLAPEASEEAILGAVQAIKNRLGVADAKTTELQEINNRLTEENKQHAKARVDTALAQLDDPAIKNRVAEDQRASWRGLLTSNFDIANKALTGFVAELKRDGGGNPAAGRTPITNRGDAKRPKVDQPGGGNGEIPADVHQAAALLNRKTREYMGVNRCSFEVADQAVRESNPELFKAAHPGALAAVAPADDGN